MIELIIGIILGYVMHCIYYYINALEYHGPNSNIFRNQIFKKNNECYKFKPVIHICPKKI